MKAAGTETIGRYENGVKCAGVGLAQRLDGVKAAGTDAIGRYENGAKCAGVGLAQRLDGVKAAGTDAIGRYENGAKCANVGLARTPDAASGERLVQYQVEHAQVRADHRHRNYSADRVQPDELDMIDAASV